MEEQLTSGQKAALTRKWRQAGAKAAKTARWAVIMAKCRIRRLLSRTKWNLITFLGARGGESVGVVDIVAIRKDQGKGLDGLKRGDIFEIILIQVKGGSAAWPTPADVSRLIKVSQQYAAKAVILAAWTKGRHAELYQLDMACDPESKNCWELLDKPLAIFH